MILQDDKGCRVVCNFCRRWGPPGAVPQWAEEYALDDGFHIFDLVTKGVPKRKHCCKTCRNRVTVAQLIAC